MSLILSSGRRPQTSNRLKTIISLFLILGLGFQPRVYADGRANALKATVTILTGLAVPKAAANPAQAHEVEKAEDKIAAELKAQGIDPEKHAVYSVYFQFSREGIYWTHWIGWPNALVEVEIPGQGCFIIPRIEMQYQGQPMQGDSAELKMG